MEGGCGWEGGRRCGREEVCEGREEVCERREEVGEGREVCEGRSFFLARTSYLVPLSNQ